MDGSDNCWPEVAPEDLAVSVLMANYSVFTHPTAFRYRVPGLHLILVLGGRMWFRDAQEGRRRRAGPGSLLVLRAGEAQYGSEDAGPLAIYQAHIQAGRGALAAGVPVLPGAGPVPVLSDCGDAGAAIGAAFERMIASLLAMGPAWRLECAAAALDILAAGFGTSRPPSQPPVAAERWEWIAGYLERAGDARIAGVAAGLGLGREAFIRGFRRHFNCTPKRFLLQRRLWRARALLLGGSSVKEAARRCGFQDPLYFSRAFRRMFGHPPRLAAQGLASPPRQELAAPLVRNIYAPGIDVRLFRCRPL